ncbi:MAG: hypothetical protein AB7S78_07275 [Candidatus Omnitrophota bacterium]
MRGSIILIVIVCAVVGLFAYSYISQEPADVGSTEQTLQEKMAKAGGMIKGDTIEFSQKAEKLAQEAKAGTEQIAQKTMETMEEKKDTVAKLENKLEDAAMKVEQQAMAVTTTAKEAADGLAIKIRELLEKARANLDNGDYQQATEFAQNVLKLDPASVEAKGILETAKEKLAAITAEKANEFKTGISDKVGEAKAALGNLGQ